MAKQNERIKEIEVKNLDDFLSELEQILGKKIEEKEASGIEAILGIKISVKRFLPKEMIILKTDRRYLALNIDEGSGFELYDPMKEIMKREIKLNF